MDTLSAFEIYHLTKKRQFFIKTYSVRQHVAFFKDDVEMQQYFYDNLLGKVIEVSDNCVVIAIKSAETARIVLDVNRNYFNQIIFGAKNCNRVLSTMITHGVIVEAGKNFKW